MPVCYNGDVVSEADAAAVEERYPAVQAVMIGRGLIADPSLVTRLTGGPRADKRTLEAFHNAVCTLLRSLRRPHASPCCALEIWFVT